MDKPLFCVVVGLLEECLLRAAVATIDVDVDLICSALETCTILEDADRYGLILIVNLTHRRCHHLRALVVEWYNLV